MKSDSVHRNWHLYVSHHIALHHITPICYKHFVHRLLEQKENYQHNTHIIFPFKNVIKSICWMIQSCWDSSDINFSLMSSIYIGIDAIFLCRNGKKIQYSRIARCKINICIGFWYMPAGIKYLVLQHLSAEICWQQNFIMEQ